MDLVKAIYAAAAQESRAVGIQVLSTLVLELDRDPRMGRNEEAYTEDPYLGSRIGESVTEGRQGSNLNAPDKVIALMPAHGSEKWMNKILRTWGSPDDSAQEQRLAL